VESGICPNLESAKATISVHRDVQPATQIVEYVKPTVLISALTGLPNRQAFEDGEVSPFVAVADVEMMRVFNQIYGHIPGDVLLRRLGGILTGGGLDAYHQGGNTFLCKGATQQELNTKLSQSRQNFREAFQMYADGRIQTIEGTDFCFGIATTIEEAERAMQVAKRARPKHDSPEWVRKSLESGGR